MNTSDRYNQLKQLGIFLLVMTILVGCLYVLSRFVKTGGEDYQSNFNVNVGQDLIVNIPGKVSIEYRWQVNKEKSKGLELLNVNHIGWIYPKDEGRRAVASKFGTPRTAKFLIKAKAPGVVQIAFEYKKRGIVDDTPLRSREITINIAP